MDTEKIRRFWAKVGPVDADGCRLWLGSKGSNGYGLVRVAGRLLQAHRVAYMLNAGLVVPDGLGRWDLVCHKCDVRMCCSPDHLWVASGAERQLEAARKRRLKTSDERASEEVVKRIRAMTLAELRDNRVVGALMVETGLSQQQIRNIHTRKNYHWIAD